MSLSRVYCTGKVRKILLYPDSGRLHGLQAIIGTLKISDGNLLGLIKGQIGTILHIYLTIVKLDKKAAITCEAALQRKAPKQYLHVFIFITKSKDLVI